MMQQHVKHKKAMCKRAQTENELRASSETHRGRSSRGTIPSKSWQTARCEGVVRQSLCLDLSLNVKSVA
jgi:hypothetical protein